MNFYTILGCVFVSASFQKSTLGEIVNHRLSDEPVIANDAMDISHYQQSPMFALAITQGISTVIYKVTQGTYYTDKLYERRRGDALDAGIKYWGAYHFATSEDGDKQAEYFLSASQNAMFHAIDLEHNPFKGNTTVGLEQAEDLVKGIYKRTGRYPILYSTAEFLNQFKYSSILASCPLWVASYRAKPALPKYWSNWIMWQYTDGKNGPAPHAVLGIGYCDREMVNKTYFNEYMSQ